jgi:hypothetical protein
MRAIQYASAIGALILTGTALGAPTAADVGDADSFARDVKYLGAKSGTGVYFAQDCVQQGPGPNNLCLTVVPNTSNPIDQSNLISIKLPAYATRSLLCFSVTTSISNWINNSASPGKLLTQFSVRPVVTVESSVFNNSAIIDPYTNLPLGGKLTIPLASYSDTHYVGPYEKEIKTQNFSRECVGGLISKSQLQAYGFSALQANSVFANPITVTVSAVGYVSGIESGHYQYGLRLFGD